MNTIKYTILTQGSSSFMKRFSIPLLEELEKIDSIEERRLPNKAVLSIDTSIKSHDITTIGVLGVLLFLPGWFALKVLDDLYEIKIKPKVYKVIKAADNIEIFKSKRKYFVHTLSVFHEELNVLIIVAAKEKGLEELNTAVEQINNFTQSALSNLRASQKKDQVQLYIVTEGKINLEPFIHENIESALQQINS